MSRFVIAPTILGALEQLSALHPQRDRSYDGTIGDAAHAARSSDHNPDSRGIVHAFDVTHDPAHGVDCNLLSALLRAKVLAGQEPRVKYLIWNRRIFNPEVSEAWRPYSGVNPHDHHMHVSIKSGPEFESDTRLWWTPLTPPTPEPTPVEDDMADPFRLKLRFMPSGRIVVVDGLAGKVNPPGGLNEAFDAQGAPAQTLADKEYPDIAKWLGIEDAK